MAHREPTEESFLKDVAQHEVKVLLDNGVYRYLRCKQPNSSNMWFDVVTWPGFLAYAGDMGAFTFTRLEDMFDFFRSHPKDGDRLIINPGYWSEKLEAVESRCLNPGYKEWSPNKLRQLVEERIADWAREFDGPYDADEAETDAARAKFAVELKEAAQSDIFTYLDDGEIRAREAVRDFSFTYQGSRFEESCKYEFHDTWEWDCREYTYRFIWCCYALVWAIKKYDALKEAGKEEVTANG